MTCSAALQKLADSAYRIASIETPDSERMMELFHRFNMETGCAVYEWQVDSGLNRMGYEHILIPQTRTAKEIFSYILSARHFGIYIFRNFTAIDDREIEDLLFKIQTKNDGVRRLIIFLGDKTQLSERLTVSAARIQHRAAPPQVKPPTTSTTIPFPKAKAVING